MARQSPAQLPPAIVTSADPTPDRPTIDEFVKLQVSRLNGNDTTLWGPARLALTTEAVRVNATPGFLDVYCDSVGKALLPLARDKDARKRLNAAIVVARIAKPAANGRLAPLVEIFLHDGAEGVALWGITGAKWIVPSLLQGQGLPFAKRLSEGAIQVVKAHPSPASVEETYRTVLLNPTLFEGSGADFFKSISSPTMAAYLPVPFSFYEYRAKLYEGPDIPPQPLADIRASQFFIVTAWSVQTPEQQTKTLAALMGMLKGAAALYANTSDPEVFQVIRDCGADFEVAGRSIKNTGLQNAGHNLSQLSKGAPSATVTSLVTALEASFNGGGASSAAAGS